MGRMNLERRAIAGGLALAGLLALAGAALGVSGGWESAAAQRSERAVAISVGNRHTCALLDSGAIECWGENDYGQTDPPAGRFSAVSAGGEHTCGLRETSAG